MIVTDDPESRGRNATRWHLPAALAHWPTFVLAKVSEKANDLFEDALKPLNLRYRHYAVLATLSEEGPRSQQALGEQLQIDRTTMVAIVDELERLGLVQRQRNAADRRAYALQITDEGENVVAQAAGIIASVEKEIFAPLPAAERRQLHELLRRLI